MVGRKYGLKLPDISSRDTVIRFLSQRSSFKEAGRNYGSNFSDGTKMLTKVMK